MEPIITQFSKPKRHPGVTILNISANPSSGDWLSIKGNRYEFGKDLPIANTSKDTLKEMEPTLQAKGHKCRYSDDGKWFYLTADESEVSFGFTAVENGFIDSCEYRD